MTLNAFGYFPKLWVPFFVVPIMRIVMFWGVSYFVKLPFFSTKKSLSSSLIASLKRNRSLQAHGDEFLGELSRSVPFTLHSNPSRFRSRSLGSSAFSGMKSDSLRTILPF